MFLLFHCDDMLFFHLFKTILLRISYVLNLNDENIHLKKKEFNLITNSTRPNPPTPNVQIISISAKRKLCKSRSSSTLVNIVLDFHLKIEFNAYLRGAYLNDSCRFIRVNSSAIISR
jgi:hypothetical protein